MYLADTSGGALAKAVTGAGPVPGETVMILLGEKDKLHIPSFVEELNREGINFFGALFPAIVHGRKSYEQGAIVKRFSSSTGPLLVREPGKGPLPAELQVPAGREGKTTALVIVDGLALSIATFLTDLYGVLGNTVGYLGGGAGSLSLRQGPCIFTPRGFFQDAAVVTLLDHPVKLGVRHGWEKVGGPLVATQTDGNRVRQLNWRRAFDVYREFVEADSGQALTKDNFFALAKGYPFGMLKQYDESVVRDPIAVDDDGALLCVGEVPDNSVLDILKGSPASLIAAAGQAAADCRLPEGSRAGSVLLFDCISRVLFMEEQFEGELVAISHRLEEDGVDLEPLGALTLGEISSYGDGFLEFFNKTVVSGVLYE